MDINYNNFDISIFYLILINLVAFIVFGIDKYKAKKRSWRIPESNLIILAMLGGSLGGLIGMYVFRHKTNKLKFTIGMPMILLLNILIWYFLK